MDLFRQQDLHKERLFLNADGQMPLELSPGASDPLIDVDDGAEITPQRTHVDPAVITMLHKETAILIAVSFGFGGYGDFLFALKLSEQLKKNYADAGVEIPSIYLVTQPAGQAIIRRLKGDTEYSVVVLTPDELKKKVDEKKIDVSMVIEAPVFQSEFIEKVDNALANAGSQIPLVMISEYGFNTESNRSLMALYERYRSVKCKYLEYSSTIYSGFNQDFAESGILLSEALVNPEPPVILVSQLDEKISGHLLGDLTVARYQATTELSMQYSHDTYQNSPSLVPARRFLKIHREFYKTSDKNQDVVMVGESEADKYAALQGIKANLMVDGFTHISFYNADTKKEGILYDAGMVGKTYRVIYTSGMSHTSMMACNALSGHLIGATGDQSLSEALSSNKMMVYECLNHKRSLIQNYDAAIRNASHLDPDITETLILLRTAETASQYERLGTYLRDPQVQEKFRLANRATVEKYRLGSEIIPIYEKWKMGIRECIAAQLGAGKQAQAIITLRKYSNQITVHDVFEGKTLLQHAKDNNSKGLFILNYYVSKIIYFLHEKEEQQALDMMLMCENSMDMNLLMRLYSFSKVAQKTLFSLAIDLGAHKVLAHLIGFIDAKKLCELLQSKDPAGGTYLTKLRLNSPVDKHPATGQATLISTLDRLAKYNVKPGTKREVQHRSFQELVKVFTDLTTYNDNALIGLLLLNKMNIASEYRWLSPRKGMFFGSQLYSICDDALRDLGIDRKSVTPQQEREYYDALATIVNKNPNCFANQYILKSLSKQAGIGFPAIQPMASETEARVILQRGDLDTDPSIFHAALGFYKRNLTPIGKGGWGSVYSAQHYSLEEGKIVVSPPLAIKQMPIHQAAILDKEHLLFQKAYPEQQFERFSKGRHAYLAMPLFTGVPLDKYLLSHSDLPLKTRQLMAVELLKDLQQIHGNGITHHDIKPKNTLYDSVTMKMHILDFGSAEEIGVPIAYNGISTAKYAIEYMPPEYVEGTTATTANDIYSMTLSLAEILGINKKELVKARIECALSSIDDAGFKRMMLSAFEHYETLDEAIFSGRMNQKTNQFNKFIRNYVAGQYDFSSYQAQLGDDLIDLLNAMQAQRPEDRPSLVNCLEQLEHCRAIELERVCDPDSSDDPHRGNIV